MRKTIQHLSLAILIILLAGSCTKNKSYSYESVPEDPMNSRIYTLDNGLKVYMTVNKDEPRIQTYIAVKVGGKNDPAETTGLAHYFEHLMFKGSEKFGTQNYEAEKPLLDSIEQQFEIYRQTKDEAARLAIYKKIDSLSFEASKLAIPNEYDKLMAAIGANGTNAYTSNDMTVYVEDIPSNQVENWAKIQADRFSNNVIRGFHTELETVYEEKNMSLTKDPRKVLEKLLAVLYPHHPYGTQTVLGTQEDLKNPSITNIKEYYKTWYVPNNMAICLSGDFDPDKMIRVIDQNFGGMKRNDQLPTLDLAEETPMTTPVEAEVVGPESAFLTLGWRFPGASSTESELMSIVGDILYNGQAGLIDLNLTQQQKVLYAYAGAIPMTDYGTFVIQASPKPGQTLEELKTLLLEEVNKLKSGDFDNALIEATVNNYKLHQQKQLESNAERADWFVTAFINNQDWAQEVGALDRMSKVTKKDIVAYANKYLGDNYAAVYKREGKDPNELKIAKPQITPIATNRDTSSLFLKEIQASPVKPIEPVFVDYSKDMETLSAKSDIPLLYKHNKSNNLFELNYVYEMGNNNDKAIGLAFTYLKYLGTSDLTPDQINSEFYKLACNFEVKDGAERVYITLSGLSENMDKALGLLEKLMSDAQVNPEAYADLAANMIKDRQDAKLNQREIANRLMQYAIYGPNSPTTNVLTNKELQLLNPQELTDRIHRLNNYQHRIFYYGPQGKDEVLAVINKLHKVPEKLQPVPSATEFKWQQTPSNQVLLAQYDAKQIYMGMVSVRDEKFDLELEPTRNLYNEYFGSGMNGLVFQEIREARGLAYTAWAFFSRPSKLKEDYSIQTFIATQNDKMVEAQQIFNEILNNMPQSEKAFNLAKEALITRLRTERTRNQNIFWSYIKMQDLGLDSDYNKILFEKIQNLTLADVKNFQEQRIKDRTYTYYILGNEKDLDLKSLSECGPIKRLSQEEIFGF